MGGDPGVQLVLLRFSGDISIKGRATRHQFVRRLLHNLRDAITAQGLPPRVRMAHNRIFVELPAGAPVEPLARVFGAQTLSPVEARPAGSLEEVVASGVEIFGEAVRGKRFAVRARRVGDRQGAALRSTEVERELGTALLPASAGVSPITTFSRVDLPIPLGPMIATRSPRITVSDTSSSTRLSP